MKKALNLTILEGLGISQEKAVPYIADAGFDGCFWVCDDSFPLSRIVQCTKGAGLFMQFIHAPVHGVDTLWMPGDAGQQKLDQLIFWMHQCAENEIPMMVSHVWTKFAPVEPNALGIDRLGTLLDLAQKSGVKIAFENAEVDKFLQYVKQQLWDHPAAGFCFDTGHELCYSGGQDQLAQFGDKLLLTHLNDNMGKTGAEITSADDCHMMPFDGLVNWESVAQRLKKVRFSDTLTFELKMKNKPGRHTHDTYLKLPPEEILQLAYEKALQFEELMK